LSEVRAANETSGTALRPAAVTWLAIALILECLIALLTIREVVFPTAILAVALATCFVSRPAELGRPSTTALLLTILFVIKLYLAPWQPTHLRTFLAFPVAHAASQGMLAWQALAVVSRDRSWLTYLPLVGALTCICLADVELSNTDRSMFLWLLLGFLVACACSFHAAIVRRGEARAGRVTRFALESLTLAAMCGIVLVIVPLVSRYWRQVEQFLNERMLPGQRDGQVGFSLISQVGQVVRLRQTGGMEIVVRVTGREEPGHLRGAAFDRYMPGGSWRSEAGWKIFAPREDVPIEPGSGRYQYDLVPADQWPKGGPADWESVEFFPESKTFGRLLAPLDAQRVLMAIDQLQRESSGVLAILPGDDGHMPYRMDRPAAGTIRVAPPTSPPPATMTELPGDEAPGSPPIREELDAILDEAIGGSTERKGLTPREAMERLRGWLDAKFVYSLDIGSASGSDPVLHFLKVSRKGHCELFASATVLLLRAQGIPSRYVTGILATERNDRGGYWVGRQRDAHAWVEAWLPDTGWVTFDTTPSSGQPETTPPSFWTREWESLQWFLQQARAALSADPWDGLRLLAQAVFHTWPGFLVTFSLLTWLATRVFWPAVSAWRSRTAATHDGPRQLLERALAGPAAKQIVRSPGETLEQYATRLCSGEDALRWGALAAWLRRYAGLRYAGPVGEAEVAELSRDLDTTISPHQVTISRGDFAERA
jgi:transglutaminase-like putative cysteine protease